MSKHAMRFWESSNGSTEERQNKSASTQVRSRLKDWLKSGSCDLVSSSSLPRLNAEHSPNTLWAERQKEETTQQTGSPARWPVAKVGTVRSWMCEALVYVSRWSRYTVLAVWERKQLWRARLKPAACSRLRLRLRYLPVSIKLREAWLSLS